MAFLAEPLARRFERRLSRSLAALSALACLFAALALAGALLLLPALISEAAELARALPASVEMVRGWIDAAAAWLESHLPGVELPAMPAGESALPALAEGTILFAGGVADAVYRLSLMVVLGYFLLCDRDRLMIRLELLAPQPARGTLVRMGKAVCRELKLYLRGQGLIAAIVGALAALGLWLVGVRSALVLGVAVGIFNMIPYFGPILGGIPAVLTALGGGLQTALMDTRSRVDRAANRRRADFAADHERAHRPLSGGGAAGDLRRLGRGRRPRMLLALPALMAARTVYRVYVQRNERD